MNIIFLYLNFLYLMCIRQVTSTDDVMTAVLSELRELRNDQLVCKTKLQELGELKNLKSRLVALEDKVEMLEQENRELRVKVDRGNVEERQMVENQITRVNENSHGEGQRIAENETIQPKQRMHNAIQKRQIPAYLHVAFSAGVSVPDLVNLGDHHTIIFDRNISNLGNAYHPNTGIFLAPVKGVYVFTVNLMVRSHHAQYLQIVKDGTVITDMYSGALSIDDAISTMRQWILEVNKGSEVWIRTSGAGEVHGYMHSGFSGFLLFETE